MVLTHSCLFHAVGLYQLQEITREQQMSLSRQQITLLGIFALFFGPLILVMLMRSSWWQYQPANLKNQGHLVTPPVHLALDREQAQGIDGKWLILYALEQPCDQACIDHATTLRQIHRASGREREHLAVVLLGTGNADPELWSRLESIYPEFRLVTDTGATATLTAVNSGVAENSGDSGSIHTYVLDPMLNVILAYGANTNPNGIHKDLKRLLKWSDQEKTR